MLMQANMELWKLIIISLSRLVHVQLAKCLNPPSDGGTTCGVPI